MHVNVGGHAYYSFSLGSHFPLFVIPYKGIVESCVCSTCCAEVETQPVKQVTNVSPCLSPSPSAAILL